MKRITPSLACLIVALDCASRAVGLEKQTIFADAMIAGWWLPAFCFAVAGVATAVGGIE